jgi:hypothetical protein
MGIVVSPPMVDENDCSIVELLHKFKRKQGGERITEGSLRGIIDGWMNATMRSAG